MPLPSPSRRRSSAPYGVVKCEPTTGSLVASASHVATVAAWRSRWASSTNTTDGGSGGFATTTLCTLTLGTRATPGVGGGGGRTVLQPSKPSSTTVIQFAIHPSYHEQSA